MKRCFIFLLIIILTFFITACYEMDELDSNDVDVEFYGLKMEYEGSIQNVYQDWVDVKPDEIYRFSAFFKAWDFDWSWGNWAAVRINFLDESGGWLQGEDINIDDMTQSTSDLSIAWNLGGNIFVESRDRDDDFTGYTEEIGWYKRHYEFKVPPTAASMRVALYNAAQSRSNVIWANPILINTASPDINLFISSNFKGASLEWEGINDEGISIINVDEILKENIGVEESKDVEESNNNNKNKLDIGDDLHRPRLFLNEDRIVELKEKIVKENEYGDFAREIELRAMLSETRPPIYQDDNSGNLWQRAVGNRMPYLAMAYVLTGKQQYLDKAKRWALHASSYPVWHETLGRSHLLFGVSLVYDWVYDYLDEESRKIIQEKLIKEASKQLPDRSLANHYWIAIAARGAAGMALYEDRDEAQNLIESAVEKFANFSEFLGDDGASQEGVGYWQYALEYMLKFMYLADDVLGINFYDHPWWENNTNYALYMSTPRNGWEAGGPHVDFEDVPRSNWYGPDYLLRNLASIYNNGYAQWLAQISNEADINNPVSSWLNLIWYNSDIEPKSPVNLPTLHHFEDMGIVSARSDWSGNESLLAFKSGPALGHHVTEKASFNINDEYYISRNSAGHCHPNANSFALFGSGQWLVRNPGYVLRRTDYQNTLLVDGEGQLGQADRWWTADQQISRRLQPQIIKTESTLYLDHIVGDAMEAYPDKLSKYERHLLFLKPNTLIVIDDIATKRQGDISHFELLFHLENNALEKSDGSYLAVGKNAKLNIELLTTDSTYINGNEKKIYTRGDNALDRYALSVVTEKEQWRNAVAFSWSSVEEEPERVNFEKKDQVWNFTVGNKTISFDWENKTAVLQ